MSLDAALGVPPLVLVVDPSVASRHWMWRALTRGYGVLEAGCSRGARDWLARRPDIDALVVDDELPDERGVDLVRDLANARHPVALHSIVLVRGSPDWARVAQAEATLIERGDLRGVMTKLASWFLQHDAGLARVGRETERPSP
jgi:response regulator RpfG family c-di-GMP phosphodiesterase